MMATAEVINLSLQRVIRCLPGYDPFAQAGDCVFDEDRAQFAVEFIEQCCTHVKGELAGKPLLLEDWEKAIVANLWGWVRPDGMRRYRETLIFVPRKNAKTTLGAALVNLMLFTDGEPGAELYSAAAERKQARLAFEIVKGMIENEPELLSRAEIYKYAIVVGNSSYEAISAGAKTKHGFNSQLVLSDELHAQPNRELIDVLETSVGSRRQPLIAHITTSDYERESICNEKHDYACKVRDNSMDSGVGVCDPSFLPVIFQAEVDDDWEDPAVWRKANPNLGISFPEEYIRSKCERAKAVPAFLNTFLRLQLNVRTKQESRLIDLDQWDACADLSDLDALKGRECWGGLDLATVNDLAALVLAFPDEDGGYDLLPFFWCPREQAEQRDKRDGIPYLTWAREGLVELTDGNIIDYRHIRQRVNELGQSHAIQDIGFDPYNATHLVTELGEEDGFVMVQMRQGMLTLGPPTKHLLRLLLEGKIRHGGHKALRWMASNVQARVDAAGNIMPDKGRSSEKIDGIVAAVMGIGRAESRDGAGGSVYDRRDVRAV